MLRRTLLAGTATLAICACNVDMAGVPDCAWDVVYGCNGGGDWGAAADVIATFQLIVTVSTTGEDLDGDGYSLRITHQDSVEHEEQLEANDERLYTYDRGKGDAEGTRVAGLLDVADNCAVTEPTARTFDVRFAIAPVKDSVVFNIECEALP